MTFYPVPPLTRDIFLDIDVVLSNHFVVFSSTIFVKNLFMRMTYFEPNYYTFSLNMDDLFISFNKGKNTLVVVFALIFPLVGSDISYAHQKYKYSKLSVRQKITYCLYFLFPH